MRTQSWATGDVEGRGRESEKEGERETDPACEIDSSSTIEEDANHLIVPFQSSCKHRIEPKLQHTPCNENVLRESPRYDRLALHRSRRDCKKAEEKDTRI
eukprot:3702964-Rhodomonas_salina.1